MIQDTAGIPIITSQVDEALMMRTLGECYGARHHGFHMSVDHYRYLAEQIVALRVHIKRGEDFEDAKKWRALLQEVEKKTLFRD